MPRRLNGWERRVVLLDLLLAAATQDWESHNVADLALLVNHLLGAVSTVLPEAAQEMLTSYSQQLVQHSSPEMLARVIEALLTALATERPDRLFQPMAELQTFQRWLRPPDVVGEGLNFSSICPLG